MLKTLVTDIFKMLYQLEEDKSSQLGTPSRILVVRQHDQLGDVLVSTPIFRALKEHFPQAQITAIASSKTAKALEKNHFIDEIFVFDKRNINKPKYLSRLKQILKMRYDIAIVPAVMSISFTSSLLVRFSNSKLKIGPGSLNGKQNPSAFLFNKRIELDWRNNKNRHASERNLDILRPFGITTENLQPVICSDENDEKKASEFIRKISGEKTGPVVGLHVGAGKPENRWPAKKFAELIKEFRKYDARIYLTQGGQGDETIINEVNEFFTETLKVFDLKGMPVLKAVVEMSDLFITNDTGPMHAGGATNTPQISLFGPTNPEVWAPRGDKKHYIFKGERIDNISVKDVLNLSVKYLPTK